jgi:hypothetical protein
VFIYINQNIIGCGFFTLIIDIVYCELFQWNYLVVLELKKKKALSLWVFRSFLLAYWLLKYYLRVSIFLFFYTVKIFLFPLNQQNLELLTKGFFGNYQGHKRCFGIFHINFLFFLIRKVVGACWALANGWVTSVLFRQRV